MTVISRSPLDSQGADTRWRVQIRNENHNHTTSLDIFEGEHSMIKGYRAISIQHLRDGHIRLCHDFENGMKEIEAQRSVERMR